MGVLNATEDSFSGDGFGGDVDALALRGEELVAEGADLLDIGAASSRPGAADVPFEIELHRAMDAVRALRQRVGVPLSIDSTRPEVVQACLALGADIVNDVSGLADERVAAHAARHRAWLVVMHRGPLARGRTVTDEVRDALAAAMERAMRAGVPRERILVDPGLGFGKTPAESFALVRDLARIRELGPVLVGPSRKGHLEAATGRPVGERVFASAAEATATILAGADIVRVHDIPAIVDAARTADAIRRGLRRVAYVGLGANLGDRRETLRRAVTALRGIGAVPAMSRLWETAPREVTGQPDFLNAVAAVEVPPQASPAALVARLKDIERALGRRDGERYGPREIDLDLLLFGGMTQSEREGDVVVPHGKLAARRFVLAPLAELAPREREPRSGRTIAELLPAVADQGASAIEDEWWTTASA